MGEGASYLVSSSGEHSRQLYSADLTAFHSTKKQGVAYARTDMGGIYKLNADDTWTPLMDWVDNTNWGNWGAESLALDPTDANKLYVATGEITCFEIILASNCSRHVHQLVGSK